MAFVQPMQSRSTSEGRCLRVGALAMAVLMGVSACTTATPLGRRLPVDSSPPPASQESPDVGVEGAEAHDGEGAEPEAVFATLPTNFAPVHVSEAEFTDAVVTLLLHMPLRVAAAHPPLALGPGLTRVSLIVGQDEREWELVQAYGQFCEQRGSAGDCLSLLGDEPRLRGDDKRGLAFALAVMPALNGVSAELRGLVDPKQVLATVGIGIAGYLALLLAPEPVSKGVAAAFTVMLWAYLGWEFFGVLRAYARLYEEAPRATTFAELREVGEKFGRVIGPNCVRILVMVGTMAAGEAALASKARTLPGFGQASRTAEAGTGVRVLEAAEAERVIVSVPEGTVRAVLPRHAVAMTSQGGGGVLSSGRAFKSFGAFKRFMGKAGNGKAWHHSGRAAQRPPFWTGGHPQHREHHPAGSGAARQGQWPLLVDS